MLAFLSKPCQMAVRNKNTSQHTIIIMPNTYLKKRINIRNPKPYECPKQRHLKDVSLPASQIAVHQLHICRALTDECFHGAVELIQAALNLAPACGKSGGSGVKGEVKPM